MTGIIKTLISDKKFGFISSEGQEKDLFFHHTDLKGVEFDELKVGDKVTFDLEQKERGPAAVNVSRE